LKFSLIQVAVKPLLLLLIAINALVFAACHGWLGSEAATLLQPAQREPERMAMQIAPERLEILRMDAYGTTVVSSPTRTSPTVSANAMVMACLKLPDIPTEEARVLADRLGAVLPAGATAPVLRPLPEQAIFLVYLAPLAGEPEAVRKATELTAKGVEDVSVIRDDTSLRNGIALGSFKTEEEAKIRQASLTGQNLKSLVLRRTAPATAVVELHDLPESLRKNIEQVTHDAAVGAWMDCTAPAKT
jgi:hypothetical protein